MEEFHEAALAFLINAVDYALEKLALQESLLKHAKFVHLVLVLPYFNADAKRVFSAVGLNKTKTRNSLALDGTLSSIMTIKMAGPEPTPKIFKASKKATSKYTALMD
ncbi:uncharacterized protein LOC127647011 [Xyrichtys novacula]|uniref:Uncharacterized protein LOC127647011 n=1 Tax=Xyrichtys novacula TaxID=13765 RepID=A0AAV1FB43_XYRNO|nr:uncharacterized protein LOC127647011 [Xyrichtys novacula]